MGKEEQAVEGVRQAWGYWLADHPISVSEMVELAVREAVKDWLEIHGERIMRDVLARERAGSEALDQEGE